MILRIHPQLPTVTDIKLFVDDTHFFLDGNETEIEYKVNRVLMEIGT